MKQYRMQDQDLTIVSVTIDQGDRRGTDRVGLIRDDKNKLIDLSLKVNGNHPNRQVILEDGPPLFRVLSEFLLSDPVNHTGNVAEFTQTEWFQSRWLHDGIWYEQVKVVNTGNERSAVTLDFEVSAINQQDHVNRLTVLWTDRMLRFQQLNSDWTFTELWIEWDRHAEVSENGKRISFKMMVDEQASDTVLLRIFPVTKKRLSSGDGTVENLNGLLQTYVQYEERTCRFQCGDLELAHSFQKTVRSIRSALCEQNGQWIPYAVNKARTTQSWLELFRTIHQWIMYDSSLAIPVILRSLNHELPNDFSDRAMLEFRIERILLACAWFDWTTDSVIMKSLEPVLLADCDVLIRSIEESKEHSFHEAEQDTQKRFMVSRIPYLVNRITQAFVRYASTLVRCGSFEAAEKLLNLRQMSHIRFADLPSPSLSFSDFEPSAWSAGEWCRRIGFRPDGVTGTFTIAPEGILQTTAFRVCQIRLGAGTIGFEWHPDESKGGRGSVMITENSSGYRYVIPVPAMNRQDLQLI